MLKSFILLTAFLVLSCDYISKKETSLPQKASVYFSIGDVFINENKATVGQILQNGDIILTGNESALEVKFGKQSAFRVRENSEVVFNLQPEFSLTLKNGKVLNILEKKSDYKIRTPSAVAAVRGTIFFVSVLDQLKSYVCACNGTIALEDSTQNELTQLSAAHHKSNFCEKLNGQVQLSDAEMMQHDDLEIFDFMYRLDQANKPGK